MNLFSRLVPQVGCIIFWISYVIDNENLKTNSNYKLPHTEVRWLFRWNHLKWMLNLMEDWRMFNFRKEVRHSKSNILEDLKLAFLLDF